MGAPVIESMRLVNNPLSLMTFQLPTGSGEGCAEIKEGHDGAIGGRIKDLPARRGRLRSCQRHSLLPKHNCRCRSLRDR